MKENALNLLPRVRFKGFSADWAQVVLGEVLKERNILQRISEDAPILAFAAGQGVIDRSERKSNNRDHLTRDQASKVYKLTEYNDLVYNPANLKYGAIDRNKRGRGVISPIYVTFTTDQDASFVERIIKSESFKLRALAFEEGTVVKRQSVSPENLLTLNIGVSRCITEQGKIGEYFNLLERLIELHQRNHEKLVAMKQALLQKMFPQNGAALPDIRFKGFEGEWKQQRLGDVMEPIPNNTLSRAALNYERGEAKNIHYGDILTRFGEILSADSPEVPFITSDAIASRLSAARLNAGDIIIADAAEDESVGKCVELVDVGNLIVLAGLHTIAFRPKMRFAANYLGYFMNSRSYHDQLLPLMQGTKVLSLARASLRETLVYFPHETDEQFKIGRSFQNLSKLIAKHAVQIKKLNNIKSACLEKMFV